MHLAAVILLMLVLPAASVAIEALRTPGAADLALIGKWFTFWVVPAAIVGGLYYGLAGLGHLFRPNRNFKERTALVSDLAIFVLLAVFAVSRAF